MVLLWLEELSSLKPPPNQKKQTRGLAEYARKRQRDMNDTSLEIAMEETWLLSAIEIYIKLPLASWLFSFSFFLFFFPGVPSLTDSHTLSLQTPKN